MKLQEIGCDAVVAQGYEAGAHRGTFLTQQKIENESSSIGLMALLPVMADTLQIPLIAAGGIMDARGIAACMLLGASAVQMGTAFLGTVESGTSSAHKQALYSANEDDTEYTKLFSGRCARGIRNRYMERLAKEKEFEQSVMDFPLQHTLTSPLRKTAAQTNNADYLSLWAGQGVRMMKEEKSAGTLMKELEDELRRYKANWLSNDDKEPTE